MGPRARPRARPRHPGNVPRRPAAHRSARDGSARAQRDHEPRVDVLSRRARQRSTREAKARAHARRGDQRSSRRSSDAAHRDRTLANPRLYSSPSARGRKHHHLSFTVGLGALHAGRGDGGSRRSGHLARSIACSPLRDRVRASSIIVVVIAATLSGFTAALTASRQQTFDAGPRAALVARSRTASPRDGARCTRPSASFRAAFRGSIHRSRRRAQWRGSSLCAPR